MKLLSQARHARNGSIINNPTGLGLETITAKERLELIPEGDAPFQVNVDGSTFLAEKFMLFKRTNQIPLISN